MTLTRDELLVVLIEECAEVVKASTKCLRFGFRRNGPGDYGRNDLVLSEEIGDLFGIIDGLSKELSESLITQARMSKMARAERALRFGKREDA